MNAVAAAAARDTCSPAAGRGTLDLRSVAAADFAVAMQRVGPSIARGAAMELDPVRYGGTMLCNAPSRHVRVPYERLTYQFMLSGLQSACSWDEIGGLEEVKQKLR